MPVISIAIVGGPCAGKDALLNELCVDPELGPHLLPVHEAATVLIRGFELAPPYQNGELALFQRSVAVLQAQIEDLRRAEALRLGRRALLINRGRLDGPAYLPGGLLEFQRLLGTTVGQECARYRRVLFLEHPSPDVYEEVRQNNPARCETYEQACELSGRLHEAWSHHPHLHLVRNGSSWFEKSAAAHKLVRSFLRL